MHDTEVQELLEATHDPNPKMRKAALLQLCPCHVRSNPSEVWERLLAMQAGFNHFRLAFSR